jgi:hypothetical protein
MLCVNLRVRHDSLFSASITLVGFGLKIRNIVPEKSPIMTACMRGDVVTVLNLLHGGNASINDITPQNRSPLRVRHCFLITSLV